MQHTLSSDAPALALDDILHAMSPSPTPQPLQPEPSTSTLPEQQFTFAPATDLEHASIVDSTIHSTRETSPEPMEYTELESMRARVQEYALSHNPREAELAAMVLRLTSQLLLHPTPAQLETQAETIAELTFQRNLLLRERTEERLRWQSEREAWDRTADILVKKVNIAHEPIVRDQESQRYVARLEDDLKATRRRLADTQARLSTLERELSRIRPLLSLQATILRDPQLWRSEGLSTFVTEKRGHAAQKDALRHVKEPGHEDQGEDGAQPTAPQHVTPSTPSQASRASQNKHHHKERHKDRERDKKHRHRHYARPSLLADARAECILVAARKIGRIRAGILSGFVKERAQTGGDGSIVPVVQAGAEAESSARHVLLSPPTSQPRPNPSAAVGSDPHAAREADAGSSSPSVRLAASYHGQAPSPRSTQRRLAPSPFAPSGPSVSVARQPQMPTHLHPSVQAYSAAAQGRHPHALPHPGYVYFAPGPGQTGPVPFVVPVPWAVPGTPPGQARQSQGQTQPPAQGASQTRTPARSQAPPPNEGASTPMDSLVSAARTLIEDEDYDGERAATEGSEGGPSADAEEATEDEPRVTRRGTRRRAAAPVPESPVPKRRRTGDAIGPSDTPSTATAGASTSSTTRRGKAAAASAQTQDKPKRGARAKGKGKEKAQAPPAEEDDSPPTALASPVVRSTPAPTRAPQVARIRSALDVLADQAAQEQERRPSLGPGSRRESESSEGREAKETETEGVQTPVLAPSALADDVFASGAAPNPGPHGHTEAFAETIREAEEAAGGGEEAAGVTAGADSALELSRAADARPTLADEEPPQQAHEPTPHASPPPFASPLLPPVRSPPPEPQPSERHRDDPGSLKMHTETAHQATTSTPEPPGKSPELHASHPLAMVVLPDAEAVASDLVRLAPEGTAGVESDTTNEGPDCAAPSDLQAETEPRELAPRQAPVEPELESGDEDAEGSVVDEIE
ncbi:hypothetical protein OH77DRAFT_1589795 [Trametes cingulata]|nr:hypothetical protein OH77DRAFT_1589795 [Trametes cingulata]